MTSIKSPTLQEQIQPPLIARLTKYGDSDQQSPYAYRHAAD